MKPTSLGLVALGCAAALAIAHVHAQAAKPAAMPGQLDRFVGSGTCAGKVLGDDMKTFHATSGKFSGEKVLDGRWVMMRYDEDKSAEATKPYHVVQYIGYDAATKHYQSVAVDNSKSGYSTGTSPGWQGDRIVFDESTDGKPASFRDTFTTSASGLSGHIGTMRDKQGKWSRTDEETCKRS